MIEDGTTFPIPDDIRPLIERDHGTVVGAAGGAQSSLGGMKPTLVPPEALLALFHIVGLGSEKYARNNWRAIPEEEHLDHALVHIVKHIAGDQTEKHLWNALTRLAFAVSTASGRDYRAYESLKQKLTETLAGKLAGSSTHYDPIALRRELGVAVTELARNEIHLCVGRELDKLGERYGVKRRKVNGRAEADARYRKRVLAGAHASVVSSREAKTGV